LCYELNLPATVFENEANTGLGKFDDWRFNVTQDKSGGYPAKNRGIYFDDDKEGYGSLPDFLMHYDFSFHTWIMLKKKEKTHTIFSKDRDVFTDD
jgi:hypothetical protein